MSLNYLISALNIIYGLFTVLSAQSWTKYAGGTGRSSHFVAQQECWMLADVLVAIEEAKEAILICRKYLWFAEFLRGSRVTRRTERIHLVNAGREACTSRAGTTLWLGRLTLDIL